MPPLYSTIKDTKLFLHIPHLALKILSAEAPYKILKLKIPFILMETAFKLDRIIFW